MILIALSIACPFTSILKAISLN